MKPPPTRRARLRRPLPQLHRKLPLARLRRPRRRPPRVPKCRRQRRPRARQPAPAPWIKCKTQRQTSPAPLRQPAVPLCQPPAHLRQPLPLRQPPPASPTTPAWVQLCRWQRWSSGSASPTCSSRERRGAWPLLLAVVSGPCHQLKPGSKVPDQPVARAEPFTNSAQFYGRHNTLHWENNGTKQQTRTCTSGRVSKRCYMARDACHHLYAPALFHEVVRVYTPPGSSQAQLWRTTVEHGRS
ncbi:hypothetical protein V5799_026978 [Amblyomma americanum]|uniref:Uncharacterized protein n=1 Tax=Amblyomma americanum TaxID=6943 RepID=A0AAQ4DH17_AMBAM